MIVIRTRNLDELNRKLRNISNQFKKGSLKKTKEIQQLLFSYGNDMRNHIITAMRNTTRAPWSYKRTKSGKRHHPSMPGGFPAVDSGEAIRAIAFDVSTNFKGVKLEFGANSGAPYLKFLEEGTDKMDARPWMEPTVDEFGDKIAGDLEKLVPDNVIGFMVQGTK